MNCQVFRRQRHEGGVWDGTMRRDTPPRLKNERMRAERN
jgi:hypothetical protein